MVAKYKNIHKETTVQESEKEQEKELPEPGHAMNDSDGWQFIINSFHI